MGLLRFFLALSVIAGHSETTVFGFPMARSEMLFGLSEVVCI